MQLHVHVINVNAAPWGCVFYCLLSRVLSRSIACNVTCVLPTCVRRVIVSARHHRACHAKHSRAQNCTSRYPLAYKTKQKSPAQFAHAPVKLCSLDPLAYQPVFSPGFVLRMSQIRKFGITQIYVCRAQANPEGIAIYRLTRYQYFAPVLSAYAFRNLRYFIQTIATDHTILWSFPVLRFTR